MEANWMVEQLHPYYRKALHYSARLVDEQTEFQHIEVAFSLVELLVVVGIIGVLVALLLTTISQAKGRARRTQCANNLRQLGVALRGFVTENGNYPLFINPNRGNGKYPEHHGSWMAALRHAELPAIQWQCPSASKPFNLPSTMMYIGYGYNARGMSTETDTNSLGLGGHYIWRGGDRTRFAASPVTESEVVSSSEMQAIGDGFYGRNGVLSRSVTVRAAIPNESGVLKPGMFMSVRLSREPTPALVVPESALVPERGNVYVYVVSDGVASRRAVSVGRRQPGQVELLGGVAAGDRVVVQGTQKVRDGSPVSEAPQQGAVAG